MQSSDEDQIERRLAAILAGDVVGYSRLMGVDEEGTLAQLKAHRRALVDPKIKEHHGRIVKTTGDGILVEFPSVVDAVRCAVEIQRGMIERNADVLADRRIEFRIGINVGDIIIDGGDIFGDGVNVAARLENLAEPGGIWVSRTVREQVRDKLSFVFEDMGEREVKNIARPIKAHRIRYEGQVPPPQNATRVAPKSVRLPHLHRFWPAGAVLLLLVLAASGGWLLLNMRTNPGSSTSASEGASVAVLPFANMSGDAQQEYLSNGITEDVLTELARVPGLFVPARNSSGRYTGTAVDLQKVGRELSVRYVLEGSVQKSGEQLRVTAQLIEVATGAHVWAQRYDRPFKDVFSVQDEITEAIATRLVAQIRHEDLIAAKRKPTENMDAYDLVLQGRESIARVTEQDLAKARTLFETAISRDATYADAYAGLAETYVYGFNYRWGDLKGEAALDKAIEVGQQSLALDPEGAYVTYSLALAYIFRGQLEDAQTVLERAYQAYPNDAEIMERLGVTYIFQGRAQDGVGLLERVLTVDPFHRRAIYAFTARGYILLRNYDRLAELVRACQLETPTYRRCHEVAVVLFVETDQMDKAREAVATIRRLDPTFTLATAPGSLPFKNKTDQDRFLGAFRKAGLPE